MPRVDTLARILQACDLEADLRFRRHDDVDRSQIRADMIAETPAGRASSVPERGRCVLRRAAPRPSHACVTLDRFEPARGAAHRWSEPGPTFVVDRRIRGVLHRLAVFTTDADICPDADPDEAFAGSARALEDLDTLGLRSAGDRTAAAFTCDQRCRRRWRC